MSRLKNYASGLGSSYLALAANIAYTLISVPLALRYLANPEFALWGLTMQIAGYIALIDVGMAGVSRILIDHKDRKDESTYGSVIQTSVYVSVVQALLIAACGIGLAFVLGSLLRVPSNLERDFVFLIIGQCALLAAGFVTRIFGFLLAAHQRQDVINYSQTFLFAGNLVVLWVCFQSGIGVFSILWAQLCGWLLATVMAVAWCFRLKVFPHAGCWGRPTWARFAELFAYGRDIFLFVLGTQLTSASQVILITRQLGLEAAAIWLICTRSYTLVAQLIYRAFDNSCPAFAEMIVRGENEWLLRRFKSIVVVSMSASVVAGGIFAVCNQPFVELWTQGKASWPVINDVLLAVGLVLFAGARCHVGLAGQTKQFRLLRYISLLEGLWLVGWSLPLLRIAGIPAMLGAGIAGALLLSFPYGTWRTAKYFHLGWREVALSWSWPALRLALLFFPAACGVFWAARPLPTVMQLIISGTVTSVLGAWLFLRYGLDPILRAELFQRLPSWLRKQ